MLPSRQRQRHPCDFAAASLIAGSSGLPLQGTRGCAHKNTVLWGDGDSVADLQRHLTRLQLKGEALEDSHQCDLRLLNSTSLAWVESKHMTLTPNPTDDATGDRSY